jgi:outer membrane lipoprotein LolB
MSKLPKILTASRWPILFLLSMACVACSTSPHKPMPMIVPDLVITEAPRSYDGRFAVQYVDPRGRTRHSYGNFQWHENDDTILLTLLNPLGQTLANVKSSPSEAVLELPNHKPQIAAHLDELMQQTLGFALPVSHLRYWLRPSPAPSSSANVSTDPHNGRLVKIQQDGWTIDYLAYADAHLTDKNSSLSSAVKRLTLSHINPMLTVKLALN